jgi:mRNA-degrading endonuclease RelE of RelBE toxin-antitoxin system
MPSRRGTGKESSSNKGSASKSPAGPPAVARWRLRYAARILTDDIDEVGHAALAHTACEKKLAAAPEQHGAPLHHPLHGLRKLRVSHVRIAYHVEVEAHEVWILMIGNRRDIWEENQGVILDRLATERKRHVDASAPTPPAKGRSPRKAR